MYQDAFQHLKVYVVVGVKTDKVEVYEYGIFINVSWKMTEKVNIIFSITSNLIAQSLRLKNNVQYMTESLGG